MFRNFRNRIAPSRVLLLSALAAFALSACGGDDAGDPPGTPDPEQPAEIVQAVSSKAVVKRKRPSLLANDLAQALSLPRAELCQELSAYDCFEAHQILLGGVEPFVLRIDEPIEVASVAAPLAADRIALMACGERAERDFADPASAVIFGEIADDPAAADKDAYAAVADRLYENLLARPARDIERDSLVGFLDELGESQEPARDWAQLGCYAVATSTEFLFY
ncbi:hypothetical protein [Haliangium ochraceum]|uniref:Lipoprotein n=1 Tax=Haliangium ochraceum (strain DSM 14365 / JCM 11303 / SMP-2) TaxID=502025 RepID=D0LYN7_HALO1|nr:hypothetical protein [Haliangium ochraceum]ACY17903.1 hypothetical protein Hoch_5419 [Haliangium ochraceum DSM 14365]